MYFFKQDNNTFDFVWWTVDFEPTRKYLRLSKLKMFGRSANESE